MQQGVLIRTPAASGLIDPHPHAFAKTGNAHNLLPATSHHRTGVTGVYGESGHDVCLKIGNDDVVFDVMVKKFIA
jgi:hypothetical protein